MFNREHIKRAPDALASRGYARLVAKASHSKSTDPAPPIKSLRGLAEASQACRACPLSANATLAVFGEGPSGAPIMLVGEQPGDAEDLSATGSSGPPDRCWRKALEEAGIDRKAVYPTNAVKHFSWEPRGKRRILKKPRVSEIEACHPWLAQS